MRRLSRPGESKTLAPNGLSREQGVKIMRRDPVTSTNISEIGYDQPSQTLEVMFRNGGVYQYFDIPRHEYDNLLRAASIGEYLNRSIKGRYRYARV